VLSAWPLVNQAINAILMSVMPYLGDSSLHSCRLNFSYKYRSAAVGSRWRVDGVKNLYCASHERTNLVLKMLLGRQSLRLLGLHC